jgi:hypothetical protein
MQCEIFFSRHKSNINDNFEYQMQYQNSKINKLKTRVIYRPRFKSLNSIMDGPLWIMQVVVDVVMISWMTSFWCFHFSFSFFSLLFFSVYRLFPLFFFSNFFLSTVTFFLLSLFFLINQYKTKLQIEPKKGKNNNNNKNKLTNKQMNS